MIKKIGNMSLEDLPVFECQQALKYQGVCGDVASVRASVKGASITLCAVHALPYTKGLMSLEVHKCVKCKGKCRPGLYIHDATIGYNFCGEVCQEAYLTPIHARVLYR